MLKENTDHVKRNMIILMNTTECLFEINVTFCDAVNLDYWKPAVVTLLTPLSVSQQKLFFHSAEYNSIYIIPIKSISFSSIFIHFLN